MRANSLKNYVSTLSRYDNSIWKPIKSTCKPTLASRPLRTEAPTQERWAKSNSIHETPSGRIPTTCAGNWRRNTWIPQITSTISWTHKTHHTKGNKKEIGLLNAKKASGMDLTIEILNELPQKGMILFIYLMPYSDINIGLINSN
jgi:hypothetical protein